MNSPHCHHETIKMHAEPPHEILRCTGEPLTFCERCKQAFCPKHLKICEFCGKPFCTAHNDFKCYEIHQCSADQSRRAGIDQLGEGETLEKVVTDLVKL